MLTESLVYGGSVPVICLLTADWSQVGRLGRLSDTNTEILDKPLTSQRNSVMI